MNISRRTVLSTLFGSSLLCVAARGDSPKGVNKLVPQPSVNTFTQQRIVDIDEAFLDYVARYLTFKNIKPTSKFRQGDLGQGAFFTMPWASDKESIQSLIQRYVLPRMGGIVEWLTTHHASKARWVGVTIRRHSDGLAVSILVAQSRTPPISDDALCSNWTRCRNISR